MLYDTVFVVVPLETKYQLLYFVVVVVAVVAVVAVEVKVVEGQISILPKPTVCPLISSCIAGGTLIRYHQRKGTWWSDELLVVPTVSTRCFSKQTVTTLKTVVQHKRTTAPIELIVVPRQVLRYGMKHLDRC